MRRVIGLWASVVFALMAALGAAFVLWLGLVKAATLLTSVKSDLAIAIVAASIAGLVSILSIVISKSYESRSANLQDLRLKKTPVYEGIVSTLFKVMFAEQLGKRALTEKELVTWFTETTEKLSIWGSNDLIRAFGDFKQESIANEPTDALFTFERLIFAIRKDLGHTGSLEKGSILRLFVNDIDDYL